MTSDLTALRDQLCPMRGTPKWAEALARLAPTTRALVQRLTQPGASLAQAAYPSFGLQPPASAGDEDGATLALAEVLMRGALDLFAQLLQEPASEAGRGYELYFRDDFPFASHDAPTTLSDWIAEATRAGENRLAALVSREASACLGLPNAGPALTAQVHRHLGAFKLLGHDASRLRRERRGALVSSHD